MACHSCAGFDKHPRWRLRFTKIFSFATQPRCICLLAIESREIFRIATVAWIQFYCDHLFIIWMRVIYFFICMVNVYLCWHWKVHATVINWSYDIGTLISTRATWIGNIRLSAKNEQCHAYSPTYHDYAPFAQSRMCNANAVRHDDDIKWKHFPRYWSFKRGIHRSPVNSPHKGQWRGALMFSLICARINVWVNSREAGDSRRHRAHYDAVIMRRSHGYECATRMQYERGSHWPVDGSRWFKLIRTLYIVRNIFGSS